MALIGSKYKKNPYVYDEILAGSGGLVCAFELAPSEAKRSGEYGIGAGKLCTNDGFVRLAAPRDSECRCPYKDFMFASFPSLRSFPRFLPGTLRVGLS